MFQLFRSVSDDFVCRLRFAFYDSVNLRIVSFPLLIGILFGCLIGTFSSAPQVITALFEVREIEPGLLGILQRLWHCVRFPAFALMISTSFLGVVLIPSLSCFRGFLLGCSVAAAFQSGHINGLLISALTVGIPALFDLPAFMIAATDSFCFAELLLDAVFRRQIRRFPVENGISLHAVAIILMCSLEALYFFLLLPLFFKP